MLSPYLVSFPPHSLRGVIMPILQKCVPCPTVKSQKWQRPGTAPGGPCPPHQAGPGQGGSQRKHGLAGKLRSAGIRYKDSKCFYHKRQLRDTQIGDTEQRAVGTKAQRWSQCTGRAELLQTSRLEAPSKTASGQHRAPYK